MKHARTKKFRHLSVFTALLLAGGALYFSFPASAQNIDSRITRLENEIQTLSRAVFRDEMPPPDARTTEKTTGSLPVSDLALRLQQVEMDLRALTGKIEQQEFQSKQFQERTETILKNLEGRVLSLENEQTDLRNISESTDKSTKLTGESSSTTESLQQESSLPQPDSIPTQESEESSAPRMLGTLSNPKESPDLANRTPAPKENDPVGSYEYAFSLLRNQNYDEAEKAFKDFLNRYEEHELAANAQYWLGETFYVRGDFKNAARIFAEGYQKYSKGPKGPDNLLKLGMSLAGMGKKDDACLSYKQLFKEYPSGAQSVLTRAKQEIENLGCPE